MCGAYRELATKMRVLRAASTRFLWILVCGYVWSFFVPIIGKGINDTLSAMQVYSRWYCYIFSKRNSRWSIKIDGFLCWDCKIMLFYFVKCGRIMKVRFFSGGLLSEKIIMCSVLHLSGLDGMFYDLTDGSGGRYDL